MLNVSSSPTIVITGDSGAKPVISGVDRIKNVPLSVIAGISVSGGVAVVSSSITMSNGLVSPGAPTACNVTSHNATLPFNPGLTSWIAPILVIPFTLSITLFRKSKSPSVTSVT